jgi:hypothetical protein
MLYSRPEESFISSGLLGLSALHPTSATVIRLFAYLPHFACKNAGLPLFDATTGVPLMTH